MQTVNINKLPPQARVELLDFYDFLIQKYVPFESIAKKDEEQPESMPGVSSGHLRIGELALNLFGSTAGVELNLSRHPAHQPLDFDL